MDLHTIVYWFSGIATERTNTKRFCWELLPVHAANLLEKLVRHGFSSLDLTIGVSCAISVVACLPCASAWLVHPVIANKIRHAGSVMRFMVG